jgi:hypothetical protein
MSLKLFALLWLGEVGVFGIVLAPDEGRWTALSARDLNCSDQFSPSAEPVEEESDLVLGCDFVLACVLGDLFPCPASPFVRDSRDLAV